MPITFNSFRAMLDNAAASAFRFMRIAHLSTYRIFSSLLGLCLCDSQCDIIRLHQHQEIFIPTSYMHIQKLTFANTLRKISIGPQLEPRIATAFRWVLSTLLEI